MLHIYFIQTTQLNICRDNSQDPEGSRRWGPWRWVYPNHRIKRIPSQENRNEIVRSQISTAGITAQHLDEGTSDYRHLHPKRLDTVGQVTNQEGWESWQLDRVLLAVTTSSIGSIGGTDDIDGVEDVLVGIALKKRNLPQECERGRNQYECLYILREMVLGIIDDELLDLSNVDLHLFDGKTNKEFFLSKFFWSGFKAFVSGDHCFQRTKRRITRL